MRALTSLTGPEVQVKALLVCDDDVHASRNREKFARRLDEWVDQIHSVGSPSHLNASVPSVDAVIIIHNNCTPALQEAAKEYAKARDILCVATRHNWSTAKKRLQLAGFFTLAEERQAEAEQKIVDQIRELAPARDNNDECETNMQDETTTTDPTEVLTMLLDDYPELAREPDELRQQAKSFLCEVPSRKRVRKVCKARIERWKDDYNKLRVDRQTWMTRAIQGFLDETGRMHAYGRLQQKARKIFGTMPSAEDVREAKVAVFGDWINEKVLRGKSAWTYYNDQLDCLGEDQVTHEEFDALLEEGAIPNYVSDHPHRYRVTTKKAIRAYLDDREGADTEPEPTEPPAPVETDVTEIVDAPDYLSELVEIGNSLRGIANRMDALDIPEQLAEVVGGLEATITEDAAHTKRTINAIHRQQGLLMEGMTRVGMILEDLEGTDDNDDRSNSGQVSRLVLRDGSKLTLSASANVSFDEIIVEGNAEISYSD